MYWTPDDIQCSYMGLELWPDMDIRSAGTRISQIIFYCY